MFKVYKITNLINNKIYIGQTSKKLEERLKKHFISSSEKRHKNNDFKKDLKKFGLTNFKIELLFESFDKIEINKKEKELINFYFKKDKKNTYNKTINSNGGYIKISDEKKKEVSKKISLKLTGELNGLSKSINLLNTENNKILKFGSVAEANRFLKTENIFIADSTLKRKLSGKIINNKIKHYIVIK